eukprot:365423_1
MLLTGPCTTSCALFLHFDMIFNESIMARCHRVSHNEETIELPLSPCNTSIIALSTHTNTANDWNTTYRSQPHTQTYSDSFEFIPIATDITDIPSASIEMKTSDHDSHLGAVFHDIIMDTIIHEFDEDPTITNNEDTQLLETEYSISSSYHVHEIPSIATKHRFQAIKDVECYLTFKRTLWIMTLFAIGTYQFFYYRLYYISGLLAYTSCVLYGLLFLPCIAYNLINYCCSWILLVIRLFHMISILILFSGVESCKYYYFGHDVNALSKLCQLLYMSLFIAMISCWMMDFYVIDYPRFVVKKYKGIHCCRLEYLILPDGSWKNDMQPITSWDRVLTLILLLSSFGSMMLSDITIRKMEMDM